MYSLTTNEIKVSVKPHYQASFSKPAEEQYIFSYLIIIENLGDAPVQLLRRYWIITDGMGMARDIEGEGVVGETPVIESGQSYSYSSWCPLHTPLGTMEGTYKMKNLNTKKHFSIAIPKFKLQSPVVLN